MADCKICVCYYNHWRNFCFNLFTNWTGVLLERVVWPVQLWKMMQKALVMQNLFNNNDWQFVRSFSNLVPEIVNSFWRRLSQVITLTFDYSVTTGSTSSKIYSSKVIPKHDKVFFLIQIYTKIQVGNAVKIKTWSKSGNFDWKDQKPLSGRLQKFIRYQISTIIGWTPYTNSTAIDGEEYLLRNRFKFV